jgi:hypothetical protein
MNALEKKLQFARSLPPRQAVAVLVPAFDHARPDELEGLADVLASTGHPDAWHVLLRRWDQLSTACRAMIAPRHGDCHAAVDSLLNGTRADPSTIANVIDFICRRGDASLADRLAAIVNGLDSNLQRLAADALAQLIAVHCGRSGLRSCDSFAMTKLDSALTNALDGYRVHRCDSVALAAAMLAFRAGPTLRAILRQPDHPGVIAMRTVPSHIEDDLVRASMIRWLACPIMQRPALRWLGSVRTTGQWSEVLHHGHLMLAPERRRMIRRQPNGHTLLPDAAVAVRMSHHAQSNLIDFVRSCGLTTPRRLRYLRDLIALPSPLARLKLARSAGELLAAGADEAATILRQLARDRDPGVARLAARIINHNTPRLSPNDAATELFKAWSELSHPQRMAIASRLAANDHSVLIGVLRAILYSDDRSRSLDALRLVERLKLTEPMASDLLLASRSLDPRIAASAVSVLGRCQWRSNETFASRLRETINHENARVRANAVEALAQPSVSAALACDFDLTEWSNADENRIRANAIRGMVMREQPTAIDCWRTMLRDERPLHRISAIWVAERTPREGMTQHLSMLAATEPLPEIRTRARSAIHQLTAVSHTAFRRNPIARPDLSTHCSLPASRPDHHD